MKTHNGSDGITINPSVDSLELHCSHEKENKPKRRLFIESSPSSSSVNRALIVNDSSKDEAGSSLITGSYAFNDESDIDSVCNKISSRHNSSISIDVCGISEIAMDEGDMHINDEFVSDHKVMEEEADVEDKASLEEILISLRYMK